VADIPTDKHHHDEDARHETRRWRCLNNSSNSNRSGTKLMACLKKTPFSYTPPTSVNVFVYVCVSLCGTQKSIILTAAKGKRQTTKRECKTCSVCLKQWNFFSLQQR